MLERNPGIENTYQGLDIERLSKRRDGTKASRAVEERNRPRGDPRRLASRPEWQPGGAG